MHDSNNKKEIARKQAIDEKTIIAEKDISYIRGFVILINTIFYFTMDREDGIPLVAHAVLLTVWPYTLYIILAKPYRNYPIFLASYFTYIGDSIFILLWLLGTGGFDSPFFILWYVSIIAVAFRFPFMIALRTCFLYSISYIFFLIILGEWTGNEPVIILRCAYIFLIGMLASFITRETEEQVTQKLAMEKLVLESNKSEDALRKSEVELNRKNLELISALAQLNQTKEDLMMVNNELERRVESRTNELKLSEQYFRFVTESIPQMVWTTDANGKVDYFNQKWYDYTGQGEEEAKIEGWMLALHPDDYASTLKIWSDCINNNTIYNTEYRLRRFDNSYRWFLARGIPMKNENGETIKWFGTCTEIHEHKLAIENLENIKEELSFKNNQLITINEDLDNFIYTASHDLKAPISNIEGLITMLSKQDIYKNNEVKRIVDFMVVSTDRFKKTIAELTEVTRIQKDLNDSKEEIDLYEVIEEVKESIPDLLDSAEAWLCLEFKEVNTIRFSRKNLRSVIYNLISNSIKYRSPHRAPRITLTTSSNEEYTILSVKDNGLGMKEESKEKIFTLFKRLHTHVEGTGVGLYIVKRMMENAGGKIEVESQEDVGTVFNLFFKK